MLKATAFVRSSDVTPVIGVLLHIALDYPLFVKMGQSYECQDLAFLREAWTAPRGEASELRRDESHTPWPGRLLRNERTRVSAGSAS
jgi:hypothetical protein